MEEIETSLAYVTSKSNHSDATDLVQIRVSPKRQPQHVQHLREGDDQADGVHGKQKRSALDLPHLPQKEDVIDMSTDDVIECDDEYHKNVRGPETTAKAETKATQPIASLTSPPSIVSTIDPLHHYSPTPFPSTTEIKIGNKLNVSAATDVTAENSLDTDDTNVTANSSTTPNANTSVTTSAGISMPSEIFSDAFDELTELAVAAGIVADNTLLDIDITPKPDRCMEINQSSCCSVGSTSVDDIISTEREEDEFGRLEPGRIEDTDRPFDEPMESGPSSQSVLQPQHYHNSDQPFDEGPAKCAARDLSTIARMRYQAKSSLMSAKARSPETRKNGNVDNPKSYEEIQREKIERWRSLRMMASKKEAEQFLMVGSGAEDAATGTGRGKVTGIEKKAEMAPLKAGVGLEPGTGSGMWAGSGSSKRHSGTVGADAVSAEADNATATGGATATSGFGMLDISILTTSIEDVWKQSQAAFMEAVIGNKKKGDDDDSHSGSSDYYSDDSYSSNSDDDGEEDYYHSTSKSRGRKTDHGDRIKSLKGKGQKADPRIIWDGDSDSDGESESDGDFLRTTQYDGGANRNFLEDITGDGIPLAWHRPGTITISSTSTPTSTTVQQEVLLIVKISDSGGEEGLVEPNLVWEEADYSQKRSKYRHGPRESISLFDISTVQNAVDSIKSSAFPDAVAEHSILITLDDDSIYLFETEDRHEARKIIHGLRWIMARLTFNIIVGNVHVCSEMLSMDDQIGISDLTSDIFSDVTNQLVEKSAKKLRIEQSEIRQSPRRTQLV